MSELPIPEDAEIDARCVYVKGPSFGIMGVSDARPDLSDEEERKLQTELFAYHLLEMHVKYDESPKQLIRDAIAIYNEKKEGWLEGYRSVYGGGHGQK